MKFKKCFICLVLVIMCVFGFSLFSVKTNAITIDNTYQTNTYLGDFDVNESYLYNGTNNSYFYTPLIVSNGICYSSILNSNIYCSRLFVKDNYFGLLDDSSYYFWINTDSSLFTSFYYEFGIVFTDSFYSFDFNEDEVFVLLNDFRTQDFYIPIDMAVFTSDSTYDIKAISAIYDDYYYSVNFITDNDEQLNYFMWDFEMLELSFNTDLVELTINSSYIFLDSFTYDFLLYLFGSINYNLFEFDVYENYILLSLITFLDVYQWNNSILRDVKQYQGGYNVLGTNVFTCNLFINNFNIRFSFNPFQSGLDCFSNVFPGLSGYLNVITSTIDEDIVYLDFDYSGLSFLINDVSNYFYNYVFNLSTNDLEKIYQDKNKIDVENAFNQGYLKGEQAGIDSGFNTGYDSGYNVGYANGIQDGSDGEFNLRSLLGTIFMFPLSVLTTGLNVELWGINVGNVLMFVFFIVLGYVLIKLILKFFGR